MKSKVIVYCDFCLFVEAWEVPFEMDEQRCNNCEEWGTLHIIDVVMDLDLLYTLLSELNRKQYGRRPIRLRASSNPTGLGASWMHKQIPNPFKREWLK